MINLKDIEAVHKFTINPENSQTIKDMVLQGRIMESASHKRALECLTDLNPSLIPILLGEPGIIGSIMSSFTIFIIIGYLAKEEEIRRETIEAVQNALEEEK